MRLRSTLRTGCASVASTGAGGVVGDLVAPGPARFREELFAVQLAQVVGALADGAVGRVTMSGNFCRTRPQPNALVLWVIASKRSSRVRAFTRAHGIPLIDCKGDERKHRIAEDYLGEHAVCPVCSVILVARAPATVWKVSRSAAGVIRNPERKKEFVNHYSFDIMDPTWGHVTRQDEWHPPFAAQVIGAGTSTSPARGSRRRLHHGG